MFLWQVKPELCGLHGEDSFFKAIFKMLVSLIGMQDSREIIIIVALASERRNESTSVTTLWLHRPLQVSLKSAELFFVCLSLNCTVTKMLTNSLFLNARITYSTVQM